MIIFMGVAGSGKSVQGRMLADSLGLPWLSTGEFLRMLVSGEVRREMIEGKLLSDEEMISLMQKILALIDVEKEFVLDGFPRTLGQADWLLGQVKHGQLRISAVVQLVASQEVVKDRLISRGRTDDHDSAIGERFKEFEQEISPIIEHFKDARVDVIEIDAEKSISEVHGSIVDALRQVV